MIRERKSDINSVIFQMKTVTETSARNALGGQFSLDEPLQTRIVDGLTDLQDINTTTLTVAELWRHINGERQGAARTLQTTVRGFWRGLEIQVELGNLEERALEIFMVPQNKPGSASFPIWATHADHIAHGAETAAELALELNLKPSVAEVAEALNQALTSKNAADDAKAELARNRKKRREAKIEGQHLLDRAARHIKDGHRGETAVAIRQVLESFGFRFNSSKVNDETETEGNETEGNETATGSETEGTETTTVSTTATRES